MAPKQVPDLATKFRCYFLYLLLEDGIKCICLLTLYQSSSDHYILKYVVPHNNLRKQQTQPRLVIAPQASTTLGNKVYILFLLPTIRGWNQMHMFTDPISVQFCPLHTLSLIPIQRCQQITDSTSPNTTPPKSQIVLQSLYIISFTYSYSIYSNASVY